MSIPGSINPLFLGAAGQATGGGEYQIERSVRFNSPDSAYLSRTPASSSNRKTWTWAGWVKRSALGTSQYIFESRTGASDTTIMNLSFNASNQLQVVNHSYFPLISTPVYRDASAWYHIVWSLDTTQATASNRMKLYVNGAEVTTFGTDNRSSLTQNSDQAINQAAVHYIGGQVYLNAYLADIHFIDGQALDPTSFGEFDTNGVWQPIDASGLTYGTNGFHLPFSDNSTAAALGADTSGNGNDWTVNNITPSDGTTYSTGWALDSGSSWIGAGPSLSFNGLLGNNTVQTRINGGATWTAPSPIAFSSLRIWGFKAGANSFFVNGNDVSSQVVDGTVGTEQWNTITGISSPLSTIRIVGTFSNTCGIGAVEVDGLILTDGASGDSLVDTPTNYGEDTGAGGEVRGNYATFNPTEASTGGTKTLTNGNLDVLLANANAARLTIPPIQASGKYQWEITIGSKTATYYQMGLNLLSMVYATGDLHVTFRSDGLIANTLSGSWSGTGVSYTSGDIITVTYDNATNACSFYKNGVFSATFTVSGTPQAALNFGVFYGGSGNTNYTLNAGQRPFAYPVSGFKALCTTNLPEPTIADGSTAMDVLLWTGTGTGADRTISGLNFTNAPGFIWGKSRSGAYHHTLWDVVRGYGQTNVLSSDRTEGQGWTASGRIKTAAASSITWEADSGSLWYDGSSTTYAAWCWDAGSSTVTNTEGSITSQVRANASAGFSICTFSIASASASINTFGHGLGVAPSFVIFKVRNVADEWTVYHGSISSPTSNWVTLNTTNAAGGGTSTFSTSSTTFGIRGTRLVASGTSGDIVAYCFAPVSGYSSFGSYTGNGSADGVFTYLGFLPKLILIKRTNTTSNWTILDTLREGYNVDNDPLYPNLSNAEGTTDLLDITSNGFKLRTTDASVNANTGTYVYAAWASNPFQYSRAR
jgi:hypothetical protein